MYRSYMEDSGVSNSSELVFFVNGKKVVEPRPDPDVTLLQYLREKLRLSGTKLACGQGACGSCTVMVSYYDRPAKKTIHKAVTACLIPVCSMHGCAVTTVEGVGSLRSGLHPIQERLVDNHGIQCGFCTPGMVMSMYALLKTNASPSAQDIETALDGNLCRCTGYRPILQSLQSFSKEFTCGLGEKCCKNTKKTDEKPSESDMQTSEKYKPYDPSQEPIFPSELQVSDKYDQANLRYEGEETIWYRPSSLPAFTALRKTHPTAVLVGGFTSEGARNSSGEGKRILISLGGLREAQLIEQTTNGLKLGGRLTVNEAAIAVRKALNNQTGHTTRGLAAVLTLFDRFASNQIRNMATLGGSLVANYPNSDIIVPLIAAGVEVTIMSADGQQETIPLQRWCSSGIYAPSINGGMILAVTIPSTPMNQYVFTHKQSSRRAMDRAIVNAGFNVTMEKTKIKDITLCFGGVASTGIMLAQKTAKALIGKTWDESLFDNTSKTLMDELADVVNKEKADYRCSLALGFFLKLHHSINQGKAGSVGDISPCFREPNSSIQVWEDVSGQQVPSDAVGRPKPHVSAKQLATGEALFYSDIPKREDELFLAMVRSTKAHAEILSVDTSAALSMPGVVGYVGHEDVPGPNTGHGFSKDEVIFAVDKVECMAQVIGGIVAETEKQARRAAQAVKVTYKELTPIVTMEDAIEQKSFYSPPMKVGRGDVTSGYEAADHVSEGTIRIGAQEHFYMETQFAYVVPLREEEYEIFVGTQNPTGAQEGVAKALNIPRNKIAIRMKRMGGGFGGKEIHPIVTLVLQPAAVAAYKFQRPVRCQLSREEDITTTGGRHAFIIKYKVGYKKDGEVTVVEYQAYNNGGSVGECSVILGQLAILGCEGAYRIPNMQNTFESCKTNTSSPTAMRGFGRPQALFASEYVMNEIALSLGLLPEEVRNRNLLSDGDQTIYEVEASGNLRKCWDQLFQQSDVEGTRKQLEKFNRENRFKKRGVAVIPTMFAIGFPFSFLWQGGAHILVYQDGSVLLAHGGAEMGQGINTKMIQIASRELGIPMERIHIAEASTSTVANATTTGGSTGTDLNGSAVMDACRQLKERLAPIAEAMPNGSWNNWVEAAYFSRISLAATGFYMLKDVDTPKKVWTPCLYFTYGVACTVVEVDCLTGEHAILQTDIVMDVGRSVNPAIDVGQIEGAFMQGRGLYTMEETIYSPDGYMTTRGPDTYKIPTVADIPMKFNVTLLKGSDGTWSRPVYSSKGIGEPPLALGMSVHFAIKDAIGSVRKDNGLSGSFDMDCPATTERIRMACSDKITNLVTGDKADFKPEWRA